MLLRQNGDGDGEDRDATGRSGPGAAGEETLSRRAAKK